MSNSALLFTNKLTENECWREYLERHLFKFLLHLMLSKNGLDITYYIYIYIINAHTTDKALLENTLADRWYETSKCFGI